MSASLPTSTDFFCTAVSTDLNEHQYGTAVSHTVWFLLEYRESWRPKATSDNDLPAPVMAWLDETLAEVNGRLQFIRQPQRTAGELAFFVVIARENEPVVYQFSLNAYDELLGLNIEAILAEDAAYDSHRVTNPLLLICTHGKRDRCCAKFGLPIYAALAAQMGDAVWQTTHTGGHRFAPTLLSFPEGVSYGRLTLDTLPAFIADQQQGRLTLDLLRGRTCYQPIAQIGDYFLRKQTGNLSLDAYCHQSTTQTGDKTWLVVFGERETAVSHHLTIVENPDPLELYASSGSFKRKTVPQFSLQTYSVHQRDSD